MNYSDYVLDHLIEFSDFDDNDNNVNNNINNNFNININNDQDNSHDRTVNELSINYYNFLKNNTNKLVPIDNIMDFVNNFNEIDKYLIKNYIDQLYTNNDVITNFNCNEIDFFILVWSRTFSDVNNVNKVLLHKAIFNNILDCYSNEYDFQNFQLIKILCCTSGRIMKILSSFVLIDHNPDLGSFISSDILKSEFLNKASILYSDNITMIDFNNIIDNIIGDYDIKFHNQLNIFKNELLNSLVFN